MNLPKFVKSDKEARLIMYGGSFQHEHFSRFITKFLNYSYLL